MDEREKVIRDLTRHCGDGRLTLDELEERIQEAYAAETPDELRLVLRELPVLPPLPTDAVADPDPEPEPEPEPFIVADRAPMPLRAPAPPRPPAQKDGSEREKAIGTLIVIGGFVLLFNGMFWLAIICWFVLPGLVLHNRKGC